MGDLALWPGAPAFSFAPTGSGEGRPQPPPPTGHLPSSGHEPWPGFPRAPGADTDASGGDAITKGFIGGCEGDGAVGRDRASASAVPSLHGPIPSLSLSPQIRSRFRKTSHPRVYSVLLKFGGEEGRARKRPDWGAWVGGVTPAAGGRGGEGTRGRAGGQPWQSQAAARNRERAQAGVGAGRGECQEPHRRGAKT